jgi:hypothetical protein
MLNVLEQKTRILEREKGGGKKVNAEVRASQRAFVDWLLDKALDLDRQYFYLRIEQMLREVQP